MVFFNDRATTEIYTLSLHGALPISQQLGDSLAVKRAAAAPEDRQSHRADVQPRVGRAQPREVALLLVDERQEDRKSTRLNSSHANISYAVFCLKKKIAQPSHSSYIS